MALQSNYYPVPIVAGTTAGTYAAGDDARIVGAAPLESPALTGTPTAPTASAGTNTTQIATTAFTLANRGDRYLTTSTSSHSITTGSKTFAVQSGLSYTATQDVTIVYDGDPTNKHMHGVVTSYSGTTLVVNVESVEGSGGPFTAWTINVGGLLTAQGALLEANNLSDVSNPATALTNIGGVPTSRTISAGTGLTGGGDLTANRTLAVSYGTTSGTACQGNDARLSDSRTPSSHSSSHASAGSDPLAPSAINAQSIYSVSSVTGAGTLAASRAIEYLTSNYGSSPYTITLPLTAAGSLNGDTFVFRSVNAIGADVTIQYIETGTPVALATISAVGQQFRFRFNGSANEWSLISVDSHPANRITSGTLTHERGGLEADVSAYSGLVKISGGSTSAVTVTTAGEALLDDVDAAAQRTTLGLGTLATQSGTFSGTSSGTNTGDQTITLTGDVTGSGTGSFAATIANDAVTYAKLQNISATSRILGRKTAAAGDTEECTLSDILDFVGSAAQGDILYRGASTWTRLAAGTSGHYLKTNGSGNNPEWAAVSGGSGGTKTYAVFTAEHNQPPASNYATLDTRNSIAVLDFDDATDESAVFVSIIPEGASLGSGLKIRLHWMATTATSGSCAWDVSLERMTTDLDSDSFDTIGSAVTATSGTSGIINVTEITLTTIDSVTAGDGFRLKVTRDANKTSSPADDMSGDAELVLVEVRSAA